MKKSHVTIVLILMLALILLGSCATATNVPYNATQQQLDEVMARNLAATATNTATLAGVQIASIIIGFFSGFLATAAL